MKCARDFTFRNIPDRTIRDGNFVDYRIGLVRISCRRIASSSAFLKPFKNNCRCSSFSELKSAGTAAGEGTAISVFDKTLPELLVDSPRPTQLRGSRGQSFQLFDRVIYLVIFLVTDIDRIR